MKPRDAAVVVVTMGVVLALAAWFHFAPDPPQIACDCPCAEWINEAASPSDTPERLAQEHQRCVEYWKERSE